MAAIKTGLFRVCFTKNHVQITVNVRTTSKSAAFKLAREQVVKEGMPLGQLLTFLWTATEVQA